jgi:hypothetical protein
MTQELSEVFYTFLITSVIGCLLAGIKMAYKSKCEKVNLCCIRIKRNVEIELKEDLENKKINDEKE